MTVINAIRFNPYAGAMVCDEQMTYGDFSRKIDNADKIQSVVEPHIEADEKIHVCLGASGTSAIGDELKNRLRERIAKRYKQYRERSLSREKPFMSLDDISQLAFAIVVEIKKRYCESMVEANYNFTINQFIDGSYAAQDKTFDIKQKEIVDQVFETITWSKRSSQARFVFLNRSILAGIGADGLFHIYSLSMIDGSVKKVQSIFHSIGSGQDTSDLVFSQFTMNKTLKQRRSNIEPADGLLTIISATNSACTNNVGVGGYFNIVLFDGQQKSAGKRRQEVSDCRAKLASEIASAYQFEFIPRKKAISLLNSLLLQGKDFHQVEQQLFASASDKESLARILRGYKKD